MAEEIMRKFALALILFLAGPLWAATGVTQYGITWTFDKDYQVGQYVNGDYWVAGDPNVTIIAIDPNWDDYGWTSGSMLNPVPNAVLANSFAYDSRKYTGGDQALYRKNSPMTLTPPCSLVSTIGKNPSSPDSQKPLLTDAAILTIVSSEPNQYAFRPPYCGTNKKQFYTTQLQRNLLPQLDANIVSNKPTMASMETIFQRPLVEHYKLAGDIQQYVCPLNNRLGDGNIYMRQVGSAINLLMLNEDTVGDNETLLIRIIQLGIDLSAVEENGGYWDGNGQQNAGRKWPILFAGIMFNDAYMKAIGTRSVNMYHLGFQEDRQTLYIGDSDIYSTPYTVQYYKTPTYATGTINVTHDSNIVGGVGVNWTGTAGSDYLVYFTVGSANNPEAMSPTGRPYKVRELIDSNHISLNSYDGISTTYSGTTESHVSYRMAYYCGYGHGQTNTSPYGELDEYTEAHRGLAEWSNEGVGSSYAGFLASNFDAPSYRAQNSTEFPGYVLGVYILKVKELWAHNALFDYTERWVTNTDSFGSAFAESMWDNYFSGYSAPPKKFLLIRRN